MADSCADCRFLWSADSTCHRYPPAAVPGFQSAALTWAWPPVAGADWCGEFSVFISTSPPTNDGLPVITGNVVSPAVLQCSQGTWSNNARSFVFQWQRGGVDVAGASSDYYQSGPADVGLLLTCTVTASNEYGGTSATSANFGPVT